MTMTKKEELSWNPVLNKVIEIKRKYLAFCKTIDYHYTEEFTCVERWIIEMGDLDNLVLFRFLKLVQKDNLVLFRYANYADIYSEDEDITSDELWNMSNGFYRECRSVVIDVQKEEIVLAPFQKFFNINERAETSYEAIQNRINNASIVEFSDKLDGSMQSATWYDGKIIMAGSQSLDPKSSWRLEDGYKYISDRRYVNMIKSKPEYTFTFEYISLKDAHVVKYTKADEGLHLIGIRDKRDGTELDYKKVLFYAFLWQIPSTSVFNKTLDEVMSELDTKKSNEAEGFVINIDGFKVKVKYNDYVNLHKILSKLSSINLIIRSIADDTYDDVLSKLPLAYHSQVEDIAKQVLHYLKIAENNINKWYEKAPKNSRKEFMIWVEKNVPKIYRGFCREKFLGKKYNLIKTYDKEPRYKKMSELKLYEKEN